MSHQVEHENTTEAELPDCCAPGRAAFLSVIRPPTAPAPERPESPSPAADGSPGGVAREK